MTLNNVRVLNRAHCKLQFGSLNIKQLVVVVNKIAHPFKLDHDFRVQYRCDIIHSDNVFVFGNKSVPYT